MPGLLSTSPKRQDLGSSDGCNGTASDQDLPTCLEASFMLVSVESLAPHMSIGDKSDGSCSRGHNLAKGS